MMFLIISLVVSAVICTAGVGYLVIRVSRDQKKSKETSRKILAKYDEVFEEQNRLLDVYRRDQ